MGLVSVEVKTGVRPIGGFDVRRVSLDLGFERDKGIKVVSAAPETAYEVLGEREIQTAESEKRGSSSMDTNEGTIGAKALGYDARVKIIDSETQTTEYAQSVNKSLRDRPTIPRVSCSDVGTNVHWDLYRTPTQRLTGGISFSCDFLAPRSEETVAIDVQLSATISSWGPVSTRCKDTMTLVFQE
jgi:hypothetical protein